MALKRILIANRGEIAIRVARACAELGIESVAVYAPDDAHAAHVRACDRAHALPGHGARAYLDIAAMIDAAKTHGCDAVHPGYGFLAENAAFAEACAAAGVTWIGPKSETIAIFGDKARARQLAVEVKAPVLQGSEAPCNFEAARYFFQTLPKGSGMMLKAVAGGGGRGMQPVFDVADLEASFARCAREAEAAFGDGRLYVERYMTRARHIEVQLIADKTGEVAQFGERECSVQRRRQKILEFAPALGMPDTTRQALIAHAVRIGKAGGLESLATVEFLVNADDPDDFAFIEVNPRIQVEHTVTEVAWDVDLVAAQIEIAQGRTLRELGLLDEHNAKRCAVQARVCAERISPTGETSPSTGAIAEFQPPTGPMVRVDAAVSAGDTIGVHYDSLIAKIIVAGSDLQRAARKLDRALGETHVIGIETNIALLRGVLRDPVFLEGGATTVFIEENAPRLLAHAPPASAHPRAARASVQPTSEPDAPEGCSVARASITGTIVQIDAAPEAQIRKGAQAFVLEAMKMQHVAPAPESGRVHSVLRRVGETVQEGDAIYFYAPASFEDDALDNEAALDLDRPRADLEEARAAIAFTLDPARPAAVARRRATGQRTARENIDDLVDPGSFLEYGALAVAAQRRRRSLDDLVANTPGDGMVTGIGSVNGALFSPDRARTAVLAYDYSVLAGTQGYFNHRKTDRILHLAEDHRLPVVFFTEGGGGRPGDTDVPGVAGLDTPSFRAFATLSGLAPRIAIASGRCFAGNAAFFGCADVTIATRNANIGMGGPAMIEGGGLGKFAPEDVGPVSVQSANGVIDLLVEDEAEAVAQTKRLMGFFQGDLKEWACVDQRRLRWAIPENRLRVYDVRALIADLFDEASFLELRSAYGVGVITGFGRIEGRAFGVIANNPMHLGGALDAAGSEKAARFLQLCDAFDMPLVSLIDTPGFMVGPEAEKEAGVRRMSSLFVVGANISVPTFAIVLRKCYGLGAQAMAAGSTLTPTFIASWPTGEFGGMGLEGAVRLGYRKELEAETDAEKREALYAKLVANMYERGKAISMARALEIDAVIDPAETRNWLVRGLKSVGPTPSRSGKKRPFIDTW